MSYEEKDTCKKRGSQTQTNTRSIHNPTAPTKGGGGRGREGGMEGENERTRERERERERERDLPAGAP
jgi:hypothetical protein